MLIDYNESADILRLRFAGARVSRNKSSDPLIETWFDADDRLLEVTVHAAKVNKHWPLNEMRGDPCGHGKGEARGG